VTGRPNQSLVCLDKLSSAGLCTGEKWTWLLPGHAGGRPEVGVLGPDVAGGYACD
jgi:hypothetical protein